MVMTNTLLPGAWSPDEIVRLECLRHGQHSAISRIDMKCQLCDDSNRPGVIERRYVYKGSEKPTPPEGSP